MDKKIKKGGVIYMGDQKEIAKIDSLWGDLEIEADVLSMIHKVPVLVEIFNIQEHDFYSEKNRKEFNIFLKEETEGFKMLADQFRIQEFKKYSCKRMLSSVLVKALSNLQKKAKKPTELIIYDLLEEINKIGNIIERTLRILYPGRGRLNG